MSYNHVKLVVDHTPDLAPTQKLVLLILAQRADDLGLCWPGYSSLCRDTGLGKSTVRRALNLLLQSGLIQLATRDEIPKERRHRCRRDGRVFRVMLGRPSVVTVTTDSPRQSVPAMTTDNHHRGHSDTRSVSRATPKYTINKPGEQTSRRAPGASAPALSDQGRAAAPLTAKAPPMLDQLKRELKACIE